MKLKRLMSALIACVMVTAMVGCAPAKPAADATPAPAPTTDAAAPAADAPKTDDTAATPATDAKPFNIAMVTDVGGVNDQSFNQSSWEGLEAAQKDFGMSVKYLESKQEADFATNLDKLADEKPNLIWGVGYMMADAVKTAAAQNPDLMYGVIDFAYAPEDGKNLIGVVFRAQEPSFLVGYIAAKTTKTNKVGFIGGIKSDLISQFEYGYRAGVAFGAKEAGKKVDVEVQYADSFSDDAKGKAIAKQMYSTGSDIIFHAAGNVGKGLFEEAKEENKLAIGVDRDQSSLAPDQCLTSALKLVGKAAYLISKDVQDGKALGGTTVAYGLKEGGVGVADSKLIDPTVATAEKALEQTIIDGKVVPPYNQATFDEFMKTVQ